MGRRQADTGSCVSQFNVEKGQVPREVLDYSVFMLPHGFLVVNDILVASKDPELYFYSTCYNQDYRVTGRSLEQDLEHGGQACEADEVTEEEKGDKTERSTTWVHTSKNC